jgi:metal-responsive CopG/Arc/MetJ family transcriptional regulator
MPERKVAKVTISLSEELLNLADRLAREHSTSRSGIIAALLEKEEQARIQALMEEGYREMAEENRRIAEEAFPLASEMLRQHAQWGERADG